MSAAPSRLRPAGEAEAAVPHVAVEGLVVRRGGRVVLDVPSLAIERGEVLAVVGPNGAGKSTLLTTLALLDRPAAGEIRFDGEPVDWRRGTLAMRRRLALVFQEPLLFDTTVFDNVATGLRLRGVPSRPASPRLARWLGRLGLGGRPPGQARERPGGDAGHTQAARVRDWLERLGIAHLERRQARTLSGGEAQRTSLARALVLEPELLLLDEPFAALDAPTREALLDDLLTLLRETKTTAVLVTHDRDEALEAGNRLAVMLGGRLAQVDRPERVLRAPASDEVAAFFRRRRGLRRFGAAPLYSAHAASGD